MSIIVMSCDEKEKKSRRIYGSKSNVEQSKPTSTPTTSGNDVILVYSLTGEWAINYGTTENPDYQDDHCLFEVFYTKSTNTYELKVEGYEPKTHSIYKSVAEMMIKIHAAAMDGDTPKEIKENIINLYP